MEVPTVKIKDDKAPGGFVVINEADFDPKLHTKVEEPKPAKPKPAPPVTE